MSPRARRPALRAPRERVGAARREHDGVGPERRRVSEERAHVAHVHQVLHHDDAPRALEDLPHRERARAAHRAEQPAREPETRELLDLLVRKDVGRHVIACASQHLAARLEVSLVNEKRERLHALVERNLHDHPRLGDEYAILLYKTASELLVCELGENLEALVTQIGHPHRARHVHIPLNF